MLVVKMLGTKMFTADMLMATIPDSPDTQPEEPGTSIPGRQGPASAKALRFA